MAQPKGKVRKLNIDAHENFAGESSMNFKTTQAFKFVGLD